MLIDTTQSWESAKSRVGGGENCRSLQGNRLSYQFRQETYRLYSWLLIFTFEKFVRGVRNLPDHVVQQLRRQSS